MVCTFYGNRNTPSSVRPKLRSVLDELVSEGVCCFYVGNEGGFDKLVLDELRIICDRYSHIEYYVVLAYPKCELPYEITIFPEGMELALPKFAIDRRNRWMLRKSDIVVTYVNHPGGALKYKDIAIRQGKRIIDLA